MSTIVTDLTIINAGDATTGWTKIGGPTSSNPALDGDVYIQGTGSVYNTNITTTIWPTISGLAANAFTAINLTNKAIFSWFFTSAPGNFDWKGSTGGCTIYISSGSTYNTSPYNIYNLDGQETDLYGGWHCYVIDPSTTSDWTTGSLTISSITSLASVRRMLTSTAKPTIWVDAQMYGTGLGAKNSTGVTGNNTTLNEIYTYASTKSNGYGIITNINGIYYTIGKIYLGGDTIGAAQSSLTFFSDYDQTVVYKPMPVKPGFHEIIVAANSTQQTVVQFGQYNGTTGVTSGGITIKGAVDTGTLSAVSATPTAPTLSAMYSGAVVGVSQSFTAVGPGKQLSNIYAWLKKTGSPTGHLQAKLYATSGTFGTSSIPTGTALATSQSFDISTLTTTASWTQLSFTGTNQYTLTDATNYNISVELQNDGTTNATNYISDGYQVSTATHPGNWSSLTGSTWTASSSNDLTFRLYTTNPAAVWKLTATNTSSNNLLRFYGCSFFNLYSANLNGNSRSINVSNCSFSASSPTVTTTGNFNTSNIVPGMLVTGTNIATNTYILSIESTTSLTLTANTAGIGSNITLTFADQSEMRSCAFNEFGTITPNGCIIDSCTFSNLITTAPTSAVNALIINATTEMANITNCQFINCNHAIKITTAGTYTFNNITFIGSVYDIENSSTGTVTINATNGSNPSTYTNTNGGTTVINNTVTVAVTVQTSAGVAIQNARVAIYKSGNIVAGQELLNALTNSSGVATTSFNYLSNQNIVIRVRAETPFLSTPSISSFGTASTGGSLTGNTTYYYRVSALNDLGETLASTEMSKLTATGTNTNTITINWGAITDATSYNVYGRTTGAEQKIANVSGSTSYTDTGSITPSGALPASNTSGTIRYLSIDSSGVITSSGYNALFTMTADTVASSSPL